jgi:tetratricopeptide (TPR) repeat protein
MKRFECSACRAVVSEFDARCPACGEPVPDLSVAAASAPRRSTPRPGASDGADPVPRFIAHYEVQGRLGAGGMGVVYRALDPTMGRVVAVKVLSPELAHDPVANARFRREARAASRLDHPGIGSVFEVGEHEGKLYLAMALCEGETLRARLSRGPMPLAEALPVLAQIAATLAAAHEAGIVHRDVKPANVMIAPDGRVRLLDFGLAKLAPEGAAPAAQLTESGELLGTPAYMSPEHLRGEEVDHRADLWALGAVAHEVLTGSSPFSGRGGRVAEVSRVLTEAPATLGARGVEAPPALERLIESLLAKRREERCQSAREAWLALQAIERGEAVPEGAPAPRRPRAPSRSGRRLGAAVALALAVAGGGVVALGGHAGPARGDRRSAALAERPSLAVLGAAAGAGWLSTALTELTGNELGAGGDLRVLPGEEVARTRIELALPDGALDGAQLARLRRDLGVDYVLVCAPAGRPPRADADGGALRVEVVLEDTRSGGTLLRFSEAGAEAELPALAARVAARLRRQLDLAEPPAPRIEVARRRVPAGPALRAYHEGLEKMRGFDALGARARFEDAAARDPSSALVRAALADALAQLGHDAEGRAAADRALELASGLGQEDRLSVEAQAHLAKHEWDQAAGLYRALHGFFPDRLDYGLQLASAQTQAGQGKQALATVEELRRPARPSVEEIHLDLAEAEAARSFSDLRRAQEAATRAAGKARAAGAQLLYGAALLLRTWADFQLGALDEATAGATEARAIFSAAGDPHGLGRALQVLALVAERRGAGDDRKRILEEALALARRSGDWRNTAVALNGLAMAARRAGDTDEARRLYEEVIDGDRALGDRVGAAITLGNLGVALNNAAELEPARRAFAEALATFRQLGDDTHTARMLSNLASVSMRSGDLARARALREEAVALATKAGAKSPEASYRAGLARVLSAQGDLAAARAAFEEAATGRDALGEKALAAEIRLELAALALDEDHPAEALVAATQVAPQLPSTAAVELETLLARVALAQGKVAEAAAHAGRAAALQTPHGAAYDRLELEIVTAQVALAEGRRAEAARRFAAVLAETERRGLVDLGLFARRQRVETERRFGSAAAVRAELSLLERDAAARGFLLVARRAAALRAAR